MASDCVPRSYFQSGKNTKPHPYTSVFPPTYALLSFSIMQHGIYDSGTKKFTDSKQRCLTRVSYGLTIFEKYLSFELIILHFEYMRFSAYILAFLGLSYL